MEGSPACLRPFMLVTLCVASSHASYTPSLSQPRTIRGQYDCSVDFPFYSYGYIMVIPVFFKGARMIC